MSRVIILLFLCVSTISFAQNDDDSWRDSLLVARKAYDSKDYVKALKYYESAQKKAPDDIDLSDEMAQSAYRSRDFERAEKIYRQGSGNKKSKSDRGDAMHNLGNSQMRQKNYEGAIESYKRALRNNPNDEETRYNLSEAVRKIKEQQTPPPKSKDNKDQNQNDKDKGKQDDQKDKQGDKGDNKDSKGNESKGSNGQKEQNKPGQGDGSGESDSQGKLSNQMVERTLDKLAKKEGETKRNMMGAGGGGRSAKSGKDW